MRLCILCEENKVEEVRTKMKNQNILKKQCSENGELPATHRFCCISGPENLINNILSKSKLTIMEISKPKEFLEKWNLKIIK